LLSKAAAPEKGTVQHGKSQARRSRRIVQSFDLRSAANPFAQDLAVSCARVASRRPNQDVLTGLRQAICEPGAFRARSPRIAIFRAMNVHPISNHAARANCRPDNSDTNWLLRFSAASMVSSKTSKMPTSSLSSSEFRKALGHFTTGVTVVTVEREPAKFTA